MEDKELQLVDHLEELRKRIIISLIAFVTFFIIGFIYVKELYKWFIQDLEMKLMVLGPSDIIWIYVMLAAIIAIAGTIPVLAIQIWMFVKPALKLEERKITLSYIPVLFFLFVLGLAFGYFVIHPMVLNFLMNMGADMFLTNFTAEKYFRFILNMTIPFGILFELPAAIMFLTSVKILNPFVLVKIRKYAYFVLFVIAIVITPPDIMSDFIVIVPLLLLYEISINLSKFVYRMQKNRENEKIKGCT